MTKLGYMPKRVIQQLDKQSKLSFFNVNESLRMADCVLSYCKDHDIQEYSGFHSFVDKLFSNLLTKNDKMNEIKLM
jgi:hypothetical protein